MIATKSIFSSKTFWFTALATILNMASTAGVLSAIPQPYGILVQGVVTVILRWVTTQPVTLTGTPIVSPPKAGPIVEASL